MVAGYFERLEQKIEIIKKHHATLLERFERACDKGDSSQAEYWMRLTVNCEKCIEDAVKNLRRERAK